MGRKKIEIAPIRHETIRKSTFEKRRVGLLKKAMELSILCNVPISVTMEEPDEKHDLCIYSSHPFEEVVLQKFDSVSNYRLFTNEHFHDMKPGRYSKHNIGHRVSKTPSIRSSSFSNSTQSDEQDPFYVLPPPLAVYDDDAKPFMIDSNWQKYDDEDDESHHKINSNFAENNMLYQPIDSNMSPISYGYNNGFIPQSPNYEWNHNGFGNDIQPLSLIKCEETESKNSSIGKRRSFEMMDDDDDDTKMIQHSPAKRRRLNGNEPIFEPQIYNFQL